MHVSQPYKTIPLPGGDEVYTPFLAVSVAEVKLWAKITGTAEDALIESLISGVTLEVEKYTKREITIKAFRTLRDSFGDAQETPIRGRVYYAAAPVTLRRTPLHSILEISYLSGGVSVDMDLADIDIIESPDFYSIIPAYGKSWAIPDRRPQAVEIQFVAGYPTAEAVPADLKNALLAHIASTYQNRGDCDSGGGSCSCKFAPGVSMAVYNQYRILDFRA